jgi:hypothetical protein
MDEKIINEIKEYEDKDKVIALLEEARNAIREEYQIVFNKLKIINKEMAIAVIEEDILCMNAILAMITEKLMDRHKITTIDLEQFEFINKLMDSVKVT